MSKKNLQDNAFSAVAFIFNRNRESQATTWGWGEVKENIYFENLKTSSFRKYFSERNFQMSYNSHFILCFQKGKVGLETETKRH